MESAYIAKLRLILDSIRFEHTIFALPFAYLGMVLALPRTEGLAADGYASSNPTTDRSSSRSSQ
ncbi:MAG: hypothetical protein ABID84_03315 [Chloroflexota bacterium]